MLVEMLPMFHKQLPHQQMLRAVATLPGAALLLAGIALLVTSTATLAQRGGGGGNSGRDVTPIICVHDCPALRDGLSSDDSLKNFHRAMAVQATDEQRSTFVKIEKYIQDAGDRLPVFRESLTKMPASSISSDGKLTESASFIVQTIQKARAANQNFLTSFSPAQESGLKELARKLVNADSDLDRQSKTFDQIIHSAKPESEPVATSAAALDKALANFQSEHLALGKEMSILFPSGDQELSFNLPPGTNRINVAGETLSFPSSGTLSRIAPAASSAASGTLSGTTATASPAAAIESVHNFFSLKLTADLSDLQQNITALLRAHRDSTSHAHSSRSIQSGCGQRALRTLGLPWSREYRGGDQRRRRDGNQGQRLG
jgi:hypothetical protein